MPTTIIFGGADVGVAPAYVRKRDYDSRVINLDAFYAPTFPVHQLLHRGDQAHVVVQRSVLRGDPGPLYYRHIPHNAASPLTYTLENVISTLGALVVFYGSVYVHIINDVPDESGVTIIEPVTTMAIDGAIKRLQQYHDKIIAAIQAEPSNH